MEAEEIERIYNEISAYQIELAPDPTILGPRYINETISKCRNYTNRVAHIRLSISRRKRAINKVLSAEETALKVEMDQLFAQNETVRSQPNVKDREAVALTMLSDRRNRIAGLKNEMLDLDAVDRGVKLIHDELIRTAAEIKIQRSIFAADRVTGAGYGDEADGPRSGGGRPLPPAEDVDEDELDRLMREQLPAVSSEPRRLAPAPKVESKEEPPTIEESTEPVVEEKAAEPTPEPAKEEPSPEPAKTEPTPEPAKAEPAKEEPAKQDESMSMDDLFASLPEEQGAPTSRAAESDNKASEPEAVPSNGASNETVEDPDITRFLDAHEPAASATAKKPKEPEVTSLNTVDSTDADDFMDLLKNL